MQDQASQLDEYLRRLDGGGEPPRDPELAALVSLAGTLRGMARQEPSPAFVASLEQRLLQRAQDLRRARPAAVPRFSGVWRLGWASVAALALALVLASAGTIYAAQGSLPGDPLYPLKRATEVVLGTGHFDRAAERGEEIAALASQGRSIPEYVLDELAQETEAALAEIESAPEDQRAALLDKLGDLSERHYQLLSRVAGQVAPEAEDALWHAMEASRRGLERAGEMIEKRRDPRTENETSGMSRAEQKAARSAQFLAEKCAFADSEELLASGASRGTLMRACRLATEAFAQPTTEDVLSIVNWHEVEGLSWAEIRERLGLRGGGASPGSRRK
ncbi:MAG: hypothetical protein HYZ68_06695 [Chloroflexi bacterium]|nr:hypothetical protein [Chloroflexota bacterium]